MFYSIICKVEQHFYTKVRTSHVSLNSFIFHPNIATRTFNLFLANCKKKKKVKKHNNSRLKILCRNTALCSTIKKLLSRPKRRCNQYHQNIINPPEMHGAFQKVVFLKKKNLNFYSHTLLWCLNQ